MHRVMNWEEFTETFVYNFILVPVFLSSSSGTTTFDHYDNIFSINGGATLLIKISDRLAFNFDYTMISNLTQHVALDGQSNVDPSLSRSGSIYNNFCRINFIFRKKERHADWYWKMLILKRVQ